MVEIHLPSGSSSADGVAVLHVSTGRFLGPALVLVEREDAIESVTYISPHPDGALSALVPGTLVVRLIIGRP